MEGVREVALAHYETLPAEEKTKFQIDFKQTIERKSVSEYFNFTHEFKSEIVEKCLKTCQEYEQGTLDFNNFITLKYILENLDVGICNECSSLILGKLFFSCYECFKDSHEDSYELCCDCYGSKKFQGHKHVKFYDSQTLYYLSMRKLARKKREEEERNKVIETMMIEFACELMKKATSMKAEKPRSNVNHRVMNFDKNKKLDQVCRLAKQLKEIRNRKEETTECSEEDEEEEDDEESDDEEKSRRRHRYIDLFGPKPSRSKGRD